MTPSYRCLPGLDVSRETLERLELYESLLRKWNPAINLVSRTTLSDAWSRHFVDSAQLLALAPVDAASWVDLGSGGGFPGLVIAILANELRPDLSVTLVESDQRKAAFLAEVARQIGVAVAVKAERAETLTPCNCDILSARALAPLKELLSLSMRHLKPGGVGLFLKGAQSGAELAEALETFRFTLQKIPSQTDPMAVILSVGGISRV
jgi:16S rRNA (guanine527-N7)-methyltransferase